MKNTERDPVIPEVFDAIAHHVSPSKSRFARRQVGRLAGFSLALTLVAGTAVAATVSWNPFTGPSAPSVSKSGLPQSTIDTVAVLRRPQTEADRSEFVTTALRQLSDGYRAGIVVEGVRDLGPVRNYADPSTPTTGRLILVPATEAPAPIEPIPDALCIYLAYDTSLSPIETGVDAGEKPKRRAPDRNDERPLIDRIAAQGTCSSAGDVKTGGLTIGSPEIGLLTGLVPDEVVSVEIQTADGETLRGVVRDNAYQLVSPEFGGQFRAGTFTWKSQDGTVIPHRERNNSE